MQHLRRILAVSAAGAASVGAAELLGRGDNAAPLAQSAGPAPAQPARTQPWHSPLAPPAQRDAASTGDTQRALAVSPPRHAHTSAGSGGDDPHYDVCIVGGGIVGLATARRLLGLYPKLSVVVVEKEQGLAKQQTGHNSGVIHCGIYYKPGSLKAKLCVRGVELMYEYLKANGIPYENCGKLIAAVDAEELPRLEALFENGKKNGVPQLKYLSTPEEVRAIEPHCAALAAIHCGTTGIVDYGRVARSFAADFERMGGEVRIGSEVEGFVAAQLAPATMMTTTTTTAKQHHQQPQGQATAGGGTQGPESSGDGHDYSHGVRVLLHNRAPPPDLLPEDRPRAATTDGADAITAKHVIACGGMYSDRLARASGCPQDPTIVPFRGEYLRLKPNKRHLVKGNIYPVPDPRFPFLGFHFTPRMDGSMWLGPNAVLAFSREGYKFSDVNWKDLWEAAKFEGLWKLAVKYIGFGANEIYRSFVMSAQVKKLQRYVPELTVDDVEPGPAGIRAMAMDSSGTLVGDFVFDAGTGSAKGRLLHVRNAPSPAATSSLAIAEAVVERATDEFALQELNRSRSK